ncbi:hypothetical protein [Enterococcus sp.]|uniref:hypothetical protein n=1 Tax=Enterococcus sp. TaxID=35783 RepID=UPI00289C8312|nr:hypothetical protein [Enterococcus sp.]
MGQIYNSYYWDEFNSNNPNEQKLKQIYNYISRLSSMSQISIDRAKKTFAINPRREWDKLSKDPIIQRREVLRPSNILTRKTDEETQSLIAHVKALQAELTQAEEAAEILDPVAKQLALRNARKKYNMEKDKLLQVKVKKQVKPLFFKDNSVDNGCIFEHFKTPMDYVYDVVERFPNAKRRPKTIDFWELLIPAPKNKAQSEIKKDVVMAANSLRQHQQMYQKMKKAAYESQNTDDCEKMKENIQSVFEETVSYIRSKKMSQATMYNLICRAYGKQTGAHKRDANLIDCDTKKLLLNLLAAAHPDLFYSCFKHETNLVQA